MSAIHLLSPFAFSSRHEFRVSFGCRSTTIATSIDRVSSTRISSIFSDLIIFLVSYSIRGSFVHGYTWCYSIERNGCVIHATLRMWCNTIYAQQRFPLTQRVGGRRLDENALMKSPWSFVIEFRIVTRCRRSVSLKKKKWQRYREGNML